MSTYALFARPSHPRGWGFQDGKAHGYVVLLIRCQDYVEVKAVRDKLTRWPGLPEPYGHPYAWFGGVMDFLGTVEAVGYDVFNSGGRSESLCIGDNRYLGILTAKEVLDPKPKEDTESE